MTVTTHILTFAAADGRRYHGSIFWDKHSPRRLKAQLSRHLSAHELDYPEWSAAAPNDRQGASALIRRTKLAAASMDLAFVSENETAFRATQAT